MQRLIIFFSILLIFFGSTYAQITDSLLQKQNVVIDSFFTNTPDTLKLSNRGLLSKNDTIKPRKNNVIDKIIDFECSDSMYISIKDKNIILFGKANLTTENLNLKADSVGIEIDKKELKAQGRLDTNEQIAGKPIFKDGDKEYKADIMRYNFNTRKGLVYNVITQEQNGFLHGQIVKMYNEPNEIHIKHGKYTTCDAEHPHFFIDISKAKSISRKRLVSGPLKLVIADIPIYPIVIPFGFFPLSRKNTSGIHFPTFKDELERGFGFTDMGYYFAINDHLDLDIVGDIFMKGSWRVNVASNVKFIYLFNLYFNFDYTRFQNGPKELSTTTISNSFALRLNYQQDPKAFPNSSLSANIDYSYGNNHKLNARDLNQFVSTTQASSASYTKKFAGTPFMMSVNMNMIHNLQDSSTSLSFPSLNLNMSNIYPFKSKKIKKERFYEKISLSVSSQFQNSITAKDTLFLKHPDSILIKSRNGFRYSAPLSTSFTVLKYINISPSINYSGFIYFSKIQRLLDTLDNRKTINDTSFGFYHLYEYNFSVSASTRLFGIFRIKKGRLNAIRHTIYPSVSFTMRPDFSAEKYGFYGIDPRDTTRKQKYSYFQHGIFGTPGQGRQQSISLNISNNFQAKIRSRKDTTQTYNKINIIDNISIGASYNFAADSFNMSIININASNNFLNRIQTSMGISYDPYAIDSLGNRKKYYEYTKTRKLARLQGISLRIGTSLKSDDLWEKTSELRKFYWDINASYSLTFNKSYNPTYKTTITRISQTLNFNFNLKPTPKWAISVQSGYDLDAQKISPTSISLVRDLHCWQMSAQIIPFGAMKSYFFTIQVKDPMFDILKFKKERSWWDN